MTTGERGTIDQGFVFHGHNGPADAKKIRAYDQAFGDHKLPVLDHDGLEVGGEQATIIYYCSQGKWIQLAGSD